MAEDPLPPIDPDLQALLEKLAMDIADAPTNDLALRRFEWLLDTLILRGQLPPQFKRIAMRLNAERGIKVRLGIIEDKYVVENPQVDCPSLLHLCKGRCCAYDVPLSRQDLEERKLPFQIDKPYLMTKDPTTRRCNFQTPEGGCGVYEHRPGVCREYDCREDRRVWIDYEKRIPAPMPGEEPETP